MWKVFRSISSSEETEKPAGENTNLTTSPKIQEPEPAVNSDKPKIELNVEPAAEALPKKTRNRSIRT